MPGKCIRAAHQRPTALGVRTASWPLEFAWLAKRLALLLGGTALCLLPASHAGAADWTAAISSDWNNDFNWSPAGNPTSGVDANIDTISPSFPVIAGTNAHAGNISVGISGTGELTVEAAATLFSSTDFIGVNQGSAGTVTVDGAGTLWDSSGSLFIGESGSGELFVTNGGFVNNEGGTVGSGFGSDGTVVVDGADSIWQNNDALFIGAAGTGTVTVSAGGKLQDSTGWLGHDNNGAGTATITGTGSTWVNNGDLVIGNDGSGTLTVEEGGAVNVGFSLFGTGELTVGFGSSGQMTIASGGTVHNLKSGVLGSDASGNGLVTVTGAGSTWSNDGDLFVGSLGAGTLAIQDGGTVKVSGSFELAHDAASTGTLYIGGISTIQVPVAAGTLDVASIVFGDGAGAIDFNHTDAAYDFDPQMSGSGTINQRAGRTILTADSSGFTGLADVSGGTLQVDGSLGGSIDVQSGGRLAGSGTVTNVTIEGGGAVAPGSSIGTLHVGDVAFDAGSVYEVEVDDAGNSDKIAASGTATINGGTVTVLAGSGSYAASTQYTILTAASGLSGNGEFDQVTSNLAFLDPTLTYDASNVYLTLFRSGSTFGSIGETPNQIATGNGIESLGSSDPIYDVVLNLTDDQARDAFDQLSGEIYASEATAMVEDSHFVRDAMIGRLRGAFAPDAYTDVWGHAFGGAGQWESDGNAASLDHSIGGFFAGADTRVLDNWRVGIVGGNSHSTFGVDDRNSSASSDNYDLGLYGGGRWGDLSFRSGAAYTWHDISTSRSVSFPGFSDSLTSDYSAGTTQVFGELGYDIYEGSATLQPFVNLAYVDQHANGFTEAGGDAALTGAPFDVDTTFATLGIHGSTSFDLNGVVVSAQATLGWRHDFSATTPRSSMQFENGGDDFVIAGVPVGHDAASLDAGFDLTLSPAATLGVSYGGQFGSGFSGQSLQASLSVKF